MYIERNIKWNIIAKFAWKNILIFTLWASLIVYGFHFFEHLDIDLSIPFLPLSTIGIAVSFYLGFKNNSAYDRFWEARKRWGGIVNYSRTWANQVCGFISEEIEGGKSTGKDLHPIKKELIYRHIAYINALRLQLRMPTSFSLKMSTKNRHFYDDDPTEQDWEDHVGALLDKDEFDVLIQKQNTATQIIRKQSERLQELTEKDELINEFRLMEMMRVQEEFYNLQGKCERIKKTPLPRQYAYFSKIFVWLFVILLPFGLVGEFASMGHAFTFLAIPFCVVISWIFISMETIGDSSEDPFENFINDVPMTSMCRTIEIDLREMLGETDLPPKVKPVNGILM
jgi:putative membrane protein